MTQGSIVTALFVGDGGGSVKAIYDTLARIRVAGKVPRMPAMTETAADVVTSCRYIYNHAPTFSAPALVSS